MTLKRIPLDQANNPEMRAFAEQKLGMSFPPFATNDAIRAAIKAAWDKPEIEFEEEEQPPAPPARAAAANGDAKSAKKVKLIIAETETPGGSEPVPVGVNGRVMLIPRGQAVEIPESYFRVLENAVQDIFSVDKEGNVLTTPRRVPLYPFQRIA